MAAVVTLSPFAAGQFVTFQGGASAQTAWTAAVGAPVAGEDFEAFAGAPCCPGPGQILSDQIRSLPKLGVVFETDVPGAFPGVYTFPPQAHSGANQIANFNGGLNQFDDFRIRPIPGRVLYALGFWQCDPQGDQPMHAYDANGTLVGTIVGLRNDGSGQSFAGFVSSVPIAYVVVPGLLGDGWNHFDDLQINVASCAGDANGDGLVNFTDLNIVLSDFGGTSHPGGLRGDLDFDGDCDFVDLNIALSAFGASCLTSR